MKVQVEESRDASVHARALARGVAAALAAGSAVRADRLVRAFWQGESSAELARTVDLLEAAFREGRGTPSSWTADRAASSALVEMGQPAAAFVVLAAAPCGAWRPGQVAAGDGRAPATDATAGLVALRAGDVSGALPVLRRAAERMDLHGERGAAVAAYALAGEAAASLGQLAAAVPLLERAAELALLTRQRGWLVRADLARALIGARRGALDAASTITVRDAMLSARPGERDRADLVHAVALAGREEWEDAYGLLTALASRPGGPGPDLVTWGLLSHLADAALHCGHVDEARALVSRLGEVDGLLEYDVALADLLYATAVLGRPDHVDASFEVMLSHDPSRWPWMAARAHLAYGEHLRRQRKVTEARRHLATARRLFDAMGAAPGVRRAAAEMRAAGVPDHGETATASSLPLSPQELEIARMAAGGMTNRQIGQALFLSPRTVGSHLYRIFPKLNITSRVQLARLLAG